MDIFITIAGLIIGISAFLYFVSAMDAGKRKYRSIAAQQHASRQTATTTATATGAGARNVPAKKTCGAASSPGPISVIPEQVKEMMKHRTCPMCAHTLHRDEPLYATHIKMGNEKKVLIYGCPYCHKGERA